MSEIITEVKDDVEHIIFSGNLDIRNSIEIQKQMLNFKPRTNKVHVILKNTDNIDLSFLQLLYSFLKMLKKQDYVPIFSHELEDEYKKIIEESGFFYAFDQLIKR